MQRGQTQKMARVATGGTTMMVDVCAIASCLLSIPAIAAMVFTIKEWKEPCDPDTLKYYIVIYGAITTVSLLTSVWAVIKLHSDLDEDVIVYKIRKDRGDDVYDSDMEEQLRAQQNPGACSPQTFQQVMGCLPFISLCLLLSSYNHIVACDETITWWAAAVLWTWAFSPLLLCFACCFAICCGMAKMGHLVDDDGDESGA